MKITNKHGLPESFVAFAEADKYSAGTADISVTGLIDSPRGASCAARMQANQRLMWLI
jgi:hypothetical protein